MKAFLCLAFLALLLAGCAGGMLTGKLYSVEEATTLQFEIERSHGKGKLTAYNPKTGEKFEGTYTAVLHGQETTFTQVSTFDPTKAVNRGNMPGQGYTATSVEAPDYATGRGVLIGDKGTTIELRMEIQPGLKPRGHGEGRDNSGRRYQVQF
jgi:hypothetical protein